MVEEGHYLGGYRLLRRLGVGGTGTVWLVRDAQGNLQALKLVHPAVAANEESRRRLLREARTVNAVLSEGVAHVVDIEIDDVQPFIVSEFIDGPTLAEVIRKGPVDPYVALGYARQLRQIIDSIHQAGVVHRDIKPGNIVLSAAGPVLIDFGIARASEDATLTAPGFVSATASYAAPELLRGGVAGSDSDWWAWACTLLHMLTGRLPFGSGSTESVMNRVLLADPDLEGLELGLSYVLRQALALKPEDRLAPDETLALVEQAIEGVLPVQSSLMYGNEDNADVQDTQVLSSPAFLRGVEETRFLPSNVEAAPFSFVEQGMQDFYAESGEFSALMGGGARIAPTQTPFVVLAFVLCVAFLPIFMGAIGLIVTALVLLMFAFVGNVSRGLRRRRVRAGGVRASDWWVVALRLPWSFVVAVLKLFLGWMVGGCFVAVSVFLMSFTHLYQLFGSFYVDVMRVPVLLLRAQSRPAIGEVTGDPYAAAFVYAGWAVVFIIGAFLPVGADLREGVALPVRAVFGSWWARMLLIVILLGSLSVSWVFVLNSLIISR